MRPAARTFASPPAAALGPEVVGVTGLEPVTPRLSSACSNQLSYTPIRARSAKRGSRNPGLPRSHSTRESWWS